MLIKAAVISDTHGRLPQKARAVLGNSDCILHCGDFHSIDIFETLRAIAPIYAVRGNNDYGWGRQLPYLLRFSVGEVNFLMAHDRYDIPDAPGDVDVILFGHTHRFYQQQIGPQLWLNPGSCSRPRDPAPTMAMLYLDGKNIRVEKLVL